LLGCFVSISEIINRCSTRADRGAGIGFVIIQVKAFDIIVIGLNESSVQIFFQICKVFNKIGANGDFIGLCVIKGREVLVSIAFFIKYEMPSLAIGLENYVWKGFFCRNILLCHLVIIWIF
jgi:hypothetical protein